MWDMSYKYGISLACFRCKKRHTETGLTWVKVRGEMRLICDACKKGEDK
jgi:hypothetical protein